MEAPESNAVAIEPAKVIEEKETPKVDAVKCEPTEAVKTATNGDTKDVSAEYLRLLFSFMKKV